jgi:hypothetical protein
MITASTKIVLNLGNNNLRSHKFGAGTVGWPHQLSQSLQQLKFHRHGQGVTPPGDSLDVIIMPDQPAIDAERRLPMHTRPAGEGRLRCIYQNPS